MAALHLYPQPCFNVVMQGNQDCFQLAPPQNKQFKSALLVKHLAVGQHPKYHFSWQAPSPSGAMAFQSIDLYLDPSEKEHFWSVSVQKCPVLKLESQFVC